jgi:hypothetical protein
MINYKKKSMLLLCAVIGSLASYIIIKHFIIDVTTYQYIGIEVVISLAHYLYNKLKESKVEFFNI